MLTRHRDSRQAKTRLQPALGSEAARAVHRALAEEVAAQVLALGATGEAEVEIWHDDGSARRMRGWLGPLPRYRRQPPGDLGRRLEGLFEQAVREGARCCVAVGSDCPTMTADHLRQALSALDDAELAIGPATDGGYWLIGMRSAAARQALPSLFRGIPWGSADVLEQTLDKAGKLGLGVELLPELADVDRPADLEKWLRWRDASGARMDLSVVIPSLDEEAGIEAAIASAWRGGATQVVVADGGSNDASRQLASRAGALVIEAPTGRAKQLNAGAARAAGDVLLFLHADTVLPASAATLIRAAMAEPAVVGGAFRYAATGAGAWDPLLSLGGQLRCTLSGHPYGDQGIFVRARVFRALGGFPDLPIMEDWELVARMRRLGRLVVLPEPAVTSAASFATHGVVRASMLNLVAIIGYQLGVAPRRLAGWRNRIARRSSSAR
ncbi:MAG: TIGR04283 family arsenosugar biosynthesis glycosyltransferase [Deltaproteobacteria bacterium]|jgi:rSAM/selenodomain-associated transferase 2/rSAM/selenodomain-associated transferase 1|nr:TIGR04283 family arsenosugar biosynthesis glycosyltransferase [Deltaproteobacteria bacterium]MBW2533937.1 TIGR04283 family arsenosugar biosynthesis glycosyltransferase [Deltaproteobacteria bacterium]